MPKRAIHAAASPGGSDPVLPDAANTAEQHIAAMQVGKDRSMASKAVRSAGQKPCKVVIGGYSVNVVAHLPDTFGTMPIRVKMRMLAFAVRCAAKIVLLVTVLPPALLAQEPEAHAAAAEVAGRRCCLLATGAMGAGLVAGSMVALDQAWYADYERAPLHTFNDAGEWLQMDKAGHVFSAYTLGSWGHRALERCGAGRKTAVWAGGTFGLVYLTGVELLDGTSAEWGFSWWDMAANAAGTGLFIGQQLAWSEQRLRLKFSAHLTEWAARRPELLGEGTVERYLKDYNGQAIWLSGNVASLARSDRVPRWLNVAIGYGAEGMVTAEPPAGADFANGSAAPCRQYYLSPDIDLTRIPVRSRFLRTAFFVLNGIKVPLPTLEYRGNGTWVGHWLYF